jgi:acetyltransferase-like isoleucine patch superfamily enzyme
MSKSVVEYYLMRILPRVRTRIYTKLLSSSFYSIGKGARIDPPMRFANLSKIQLGRKVNINRFSWIQVLNSDERESSPVIIIGDYTGIGEFATISAIKRIEIGENVLLARNVYISDHRHAYEDVSTPISSQGICSIAEVKIGSNTWLGQNSVILPGVTIGRHCVIGANSVVNIDVPDYCIAAGVPAKIVKKIG